MSLALYRRGVAINTSSMPELTMYHSTETPASRYSTFVAQPFCDSFYEVQCSREELNFTARSVQYRLIKAI